MKFKSETYPDRIRQIARDLGQVQNVYEVDQTVEKLYMIANELERNLKKGPRRKV